MRAIDRKQYHSEALVFLETLKKCDSLRTGYYIDLGNKWSIEDRLADWIASLETNRDNILELTNLNLVNIQYQQYFCVADRINLEQNNIDNKRTAAIQELLTNCNVNVTF